MIDERQQEVENSEDGHAVAIRNYLQQLVLGERLVVNDILRFFIVLFDLSGDLSSWLFVDNF